MLSQLQEVAQDALIPAWVAWLAVVLNIMAIMGGLYGLGKWLRNWILRTVSEPISQVANIAEHSKQVADQNARRISALENTTQDYQKNEQVRYARLSKRIDVLYGRTGG